MSGGRNVDSVSGHTHTAALSAFGSSALKSSPWVGLTPSSNGGPLKYTWSARQGIRIHQCHDPKWKHIHHQNAVDCVIVTEAGRVNDNLTDDLEVTHGPELPLDSTMTFVNLAAHVRRVRR